MDMESELPASVPGPVPPDDRRAWYAPAVRSQYPVTHGIVATVVEDEDGYRYRVREPRLSDSEAAALEQVESRFDDVPLSRPRTRAGAVERVEDGLPERLRNRINHIENRSPAGRRRLSYHLLASLRSLGQLTPLALDDRVRIADTAADRLAVHTRDFAPAITDLPAETPYLERFLGERVTRKEVDVFGFEIPVTIVRGHLLGSDDFDLSYVVGEPDLLPGDRELIETVKERILEAPPNGVLEGEYAGVTERARTLLRRRFGYRPLLRLTELFPGQGRRRVRPRFGRDTAESTSRTGRLDALAYYVTRDLVGDGKLTVPLRDSGIRAIEADNTGGKISVVSRREGAVADTRLHTTLSINETDEFVDLARSLAAEGGVELSVDRPTATVSLERNTDGGQRTMHCSIALPGTDDRGHVSIATGRETPPTPIALVERGQLTAELVAAIWTAAAAGGSVVFLGPVDAEPAAVLGAHAPFIPATERPVAIGPGATQVDLPQETALALPQESGSHDEHRWATRIERDALHPDVAVIAELNSPGGLERFGTILASGRQVFAAGRIASRSLFATSLARAEIEHQIRSGVDLVVELPLPGAETVATGWRPVEPAATEAPEERSHAESNGRVAWERLFDPEEAADQQSLSSRFVDGLRGFRSASDLSLESAFSRRKRYVQYLLSEGATDRESLMRFLADLRTDEAATIERIRDRNER
ncbi:MAG: hypothetical protein U5K70_00505 [Halodesulfurarchaeum sp.]|nr:hypothetical protein [Halodesulfurarchaeum sp.]